MARNTINAILKDHGIEPAPERGMNTPWKTFLAAQWNGLFEQLRELSALFQRLMQERAAVFQQALPFFLSQSTGENQPADHARERAGCLLVARPF